MLFAPSCKVDACAVQSGIPSSTKCACMVLGMCKEALAQVGVLQARMQHLKAQYSPASGFSLEPGGEELVTLVLESALNSVSLVSFIYFFPDCCMTASS